MATGSRPVFHSAGQLPHRPAQRTGLLRGQAHWRGEQLHDERGGPERPACNPLRAREGSAALGSVQLPVQRGAWPGGPALVRPAQDPAADPGLLPARKAPRHPQHESVCLSFSSRSVKCTVLGINKVTKWLCCSKVRC